jgi:hypothetical protein
MPSANQVIAPCRVRSFEHEIVDEREIWIREGIEYRQIPDERFSVDDPDHIAVESLAASQLIGRHWGMLQFDDQAALELQVGYMRFPIRVVSDDLAAFGRKAFLPRPMPRPFVFPPEVTHTAPLVSPVPSDPLSAFCDCLATADLAFSDGVRCRQ